MRLTRRSSVALLVLLPVIAAAQDVEPLPLIPLPESPAQTVSATPATQQSAPKPAPLETLVVTGELVQRDERRTTSSVAVQTGAQIERSTARDVYDTIRSTPNVSLNDDSSGYGSMSIRGIASYGGVTNGGSYIYSSATGIVLDGVGLPREAQGYADLSAFDLDRVEIFRGPQSTSQGRNAMAGVVVIDSAKPDLAPVSGLDSLDWRGRLAGSTEAGYQGATALDYTPIADVLGLRLGVDHRAVRGDIANVTLGQSDWSRDASHGSKLRLAWQPGGTNGSYRALFSVRDLNRYSGSRYVEQSRERQRVATANEPSDTRMRAQLYSLEQNLDLGQRWSLHSVSAYITTHTLTRFDLDYSADDDGAMQVDQPARNFSQELQARYEGEALRGTVGAYYADGRDSAVANSVFPVNSVLAYAGLCNLALLCSAPLGNVASDTALPTRTVDTALFGEADWRVLHRLTFTAGLRLDHEHSHRDYIVDTRGDTVTAQTAVLLLQTAGAYGPNGSTPVDRTFTTVLPKLALVYEVFDGWFAGISHTQGYRPGGGGYNPASQRRFEFDAEHTYNYEFSLKGGWRPWHLDGALSVFHTDWKNMQVMTGSSFDLYIDNAGLARVDGGELELRFRPLRSLRVIGGLGISQGHFVNYKSVNGDFSGNPLPRAPRRTASLALEWQATSSLLIRPDLNYTGGTSAQPDDGPTHRLPAYTLLNLAVRWRQGPFTLFMNGQNLTDRFYRTDAVTFGLTSKDISALGPGRRVMAGLDFQF